MGIKTVPQPPNSPDLAPCDFCLFPKLRGCHYETIEDMKEVLTRSHKRTSMGPSRSNWNGTSALQPEEITSWLELHVCTISLETCSMILVYIYMVWFRLLSWVLWHINLCRLFCAKSIQIKQLYVTIQLGVNTVLMSKTVLFQIVQLSISMQFKCKYGLIVKNISISSYSV